MGPARARWGDRGGQCSERHAGLSLRSSQDCADLLARLPGAHKPVALGGKRRAQRSDQTWRRTLGASAPRSRSRCRVSSLHIWCWLRTRGRFAHADARCVGVDAAGAEHQERADPRARTRGCLTFGRSSRVQADANNGAVLVARQLDEFISPHRDDAFTSKLQQSNRWRLRRSRSWVVQFDRHGGP